MRKAILCIAAVAAVMAVVSWVGPQGAGVAYASPVRGVLTAYYYDFPAAAAAGTPRRERETAEVAVAASAAREALHEDDRWDSRYTVSDKETIRETFDLGAGARSIDVDNVTGSIEIVGTDGNQVTLVVQRTNRAETQRLLEEARKEVTLEIKQEGGSLKLIMDGPFRCRCSDGDRQRWNVNFRGDAGYSVKMDFQLQVPRNIDFRLATVNDGEIKVSDLRGHYSVQNVNGGIDMNSVGGSGRAHTVNGGVKVVFRENPDQNSSFKSINGDIELFFARGLSADFRFKTFNGSVYSDFPVTSLPLRPMTAAQDGRKRVFRTDRYTGGRVGNGGIEISTENLNGDIRIREKQ